MIQRSEVLAMKSPKVPAKTNSEAAVRRTSPADSSSELPIVFAQYGPAAASRSRASSPGGAETGNPALPGPCPGRNARLRCGPRCGGGTA